MGELRFNVVGFLFWGWVFVVVAVVIVKLIWGAW